METKIKLLEQQVKQVCRKIDKLDKKVEKGFTEITDYYVRVDNYQRDMKAIEKEDRQHTEEIKCLKAGINKLIWLMASTVIGFIIMQILTYTNR